MKSYELQVAHFLSSFSDREAVVKGVRIWLEGIEAGFTRQGWKPQAERPVDREYFELDGVFYAQDETFKGELKLEEIYVMPKCPECEADLLLHYICTRDKTNRAGWRSMWECPDCTYHEYSLKSINDWYSELQRR